MSIGQIGAVGRLGLTPVKGVGWAAEVYPWGRRHAVTDRLGVRLSYDGRHRHNAIFNHGDLQPSVADVEMPIIVRRNVFYDGSRRHGGDIYDGSISHAGSAKYFAGAFYNSPVETILTA